MEVKICFNAKIIIEIDDKFKPLDSTDLIYSSYTNKIADKKLLNLQKECLKSCLSKICNNNNNNNNNNNKVEEICITHIFGEKSSLYDLLEDGYL
jgi:hypothetical protein